MGEASGFLIFENPCETTIACGWQPTMTLADYAGVFVLAAEALLDHFALGPGLCSGASPLGRR